MNITETSDKYEPIHARHDFLFLFLGYITLRRVNMAEMVRVNTRISSELNDWLDDQYEQSGIPKSTLVMLALENYRKEKMVIEKMGDFQKIMEKLEKLSTE